MSGDERRDDVRFLSELSVVLRPSKGGAPIDDRATAHDVSLKGFKLETQSQLAEKTLVSFTLELPRGESVNGKGRIVWSNRETFATWAGVEIISMSWSDKRRLDQLLNPGRVDWSRMSNICVRFVVAITLVVLAHRVMFSSHLREVMVALSPKIIALVVMGWALLGMLKKEKR